MTIRNYPTLKLLDKTPKQKINRHGKQIVSSIWKQSINFMYWLRDQLLPPHTITLKLVYPNDQPAICVGWISNTHNLRKYRTNTGGYIRIFLKKKSNNKPPQTIIYINHIRATKLLNPSHKTYKIVVTYGDRHHKIYPEKPYIHKKMSLYKRVIRLFW